MSDPTSWSQLSSSELIDRAQRVVESHKGNLTKASILVQAAQVRATQEATFELSEKLTQANFALAELGFAAQRTTGS